MDTREYSRVKMRCRRGLKELDVVFAHYLQHYYLQADDDEKQCLDELLETQDPVLFDWVLGMTPVPERYTSLISKLRLAHE
jgi:antitoxin CptB